MELQLMQLRKKAGYKNRDDFADKIGVERRTYKAWEARERNMNFPQACMVADALNCSLDELAGRSAPNKLTDPYEHELIENYRASTPERQDRLIDTSRDFAAMSKDAAERDELSSSQASA